MEATERDAEFARPGNVGDGGGSARQTVTAESNSQLLFSLRKVRDDLNRRCDSLEALQREQLQQVKDIGLAVADLATKVEVHGSTITDSVIGEVKTALGAALDSPKSGLGKSDHSTRKKTSARTFPNLGLLIEKERGSVPVLRWLSLVTVVSFVRQQPNARGWISEATFEKLEDSLSTLSRTSGLSVLLFSVTAGDKNDRYHTDTGRAWSFLLRNVLTSILWYAKQKLFKKTPQIADASFPLDLAENPDTSVLGKEMPKWLGAMTRKKKIVLIVNDVEDLIEAVRGEPSSTTAAGEDGAAPVRKKRKKNVEDEDSENCGNVVRQLRTRLTRMMSNGRTEARVQIYSNVLFIMEKIREYSSVQEAKAAGYEVVFHSAQDALENFIPNPDVLRKTIWDIPNSRTADIQEKGNQLTSVEMNAIHEWNSSLLAGLQSNFPSLTVTFKYKKTVIRGSGDTADGHPEFTQPNLMWPVEETVKLHSAALSVLMDAVKVDATEFLRASPVSLKAVHIVAIALRGLLRKCLNQNLSQLEKVALGNVTDDELRKGGTAVTAMLGKATGNKPSRLEGERTLKFDLPWAKYKVEKEERQAQQRSTEMHNLGDEFNEDGDLDEDEDEDEDYDWMSKVGGGQSSGI